MKYNLFLDDKRKPPGEIDIKWLVAKSYNEFVKIVLENGIPCQVMFDHDLAWEHFPMNNVKNGVGVVIDRSNYKEKTGYDACKWLIDYCKLGGFSMPVCSCHSTNRRGKEDILKLLRG